MLVKEGTKTAYILFMCLLVVVIFALFYRVIESDSRRVELLNQLEACGCEIP